MSRTVRRTKNVRSWYSREAKWARKHTNRQNRNTARQIIKTMRDPDETVVPDPPSTGGWVTH